MSRKGSAVLGVVVVIGALVALAVTLRHDGRNDSLTVTVAGQIVRVRAGTTLSEAALDFRLRPQPGDLIDVDGKVLRRGAAPGAILLDGRVRPARTPLRDGDVISLVAGRDQREPIHRRVVRVPGGLPANPQFVLTRTPGSEVILRGAISHKLVSARFVPEGGPVQARRVVALSFDDGPSPVYTPRVLAVLKRLHVRATFFVVGYLADEYPALVRDEVRAGMSVGNHSYNHPEVPPFDQLPQRLLTDEITLGARSLRRVGVDPTLLRPPGGSYSAAVVAAAAQVGERIVLWSVDPGDWRPGATATEITRNVLAAARAGSIVILHDGGGDRAATVAALPKIVHGLRHRHLRLILVTAG